MHRIAIILTVAVLVTPLAASADTINGCVKQSNGKLRLVADLGQCKSNEAPISWESQGPEGEKGDKGDPGESQCAASPVPTEFGLVGITQATFDGFHLQWAFDAGCNSEFPGSRLCGTSEEINTLAPGVDAAAAEAALPLLPFQNIVWSGGAIWGKDNCTFPIGNEIFAGGRLGLAGISRSTLILTNVLDCSGGVSPRLNDPSELHPLLYCAAVR